jgi:hypothetical protein
VSPVRYELNVYTLFRRNLVFKGLIKFSFLFNYDLSPLTITSRVSLGWRFKYFPPIFGDIK